MNTPSLDRFSQPVDEFCDYERQEEIAEERADREEDNDE